MKTFAKNTVVLALIVTGVLVSTLAMAASNVANTKHNFSISGTSSFHEIGFTQVCVFCHTPHNAGQTRLLWNKAGGNPGTFFKMYTSSGSLTSFTKKSKLETDSPSLFCLSCHDGKTAMNVLHNSGQGTAAPGYPAGSKYASGNADFLAPQAMPDGWGGFLPSVDLGSTTGTQDRAGNDLTDDHPIGFSYDSVLTEEVANSLHTTNEAKNAGIRFFGATNRVECSSCHDPHADYVTTPELKPFLVKSNAGSALCLACHNK